MLTNIQYHILKKISPGEADCCTGAIYKDKSKLDVLLGPEFLDNISNKTVVDFGCGEGTQAIEMAQRGAGRVIGIDNREDILDMARQQALNAGVQDTCQFTTETNDLADIVVSLDAFEHFEDPAAILSAMNSVLKPKGEVLVAFGPSWYHPLGGHLFSVFPWAHLLFSEEALIRWRSTIRSDGATKFSEVAGGLNQMTIARFEKLVAESPLRFERLELVPIRKLRHLHNQFTREFTTAVVRCRLKKR